MTAIDRRLAALPPSVLRGLKRGLEKEGLRVRPDGRLADTPHPPALGSALTHPRITTDFSEAQLELITGVHTDAESCLRELTELHQVVYRAIGDELVWCASMPCRLPSDDQIPIAQYGTSNAARLKTLYREGLSRRYGRRMQVISGIHYNFSLPADAWPHLRDGDDATVSDEHYQDRRYLGLIRNFRRHSWLLLLLLGASPAACGSFAPGRGQELSTWPSGSVYGPHATSLRMGRLGYQSDAQASLAVSFNDLGGYAATLRRALTEPWPAYEAIGLRDGDTYRQLSTALLQLENEFYGSIRPKRTTKDGERPLRALGSRGIEYLEVRCLDVNPFLPVGIDADTMRLLDIFLLHCLLSDSPPDCPREVDAMARNQRLVAERGRDPGVRLDRGGEETSPAQWGEALLGECGAIAAALDGACGDGRHGEVLSRARRALREPDALPSARVLRETEHSHATSFPGFVLEHSRRNRDAVMALPFAPDAQARHAQLAAWSLAEQGRIESGDTLAFEDYRRAYIGQDLLSGPHFAG